MTGRLLLIAVLLLGTSVDAHAQAWDMPSFFSPRPGEDIGLYVIKVDNLDDLGFAGIWRMEGNINLGVRAAYLGSDHYGIGAEFYRPLNLLGPQSPLLLAWNLGVGATFNDLTVLRIPLGVSGGIALGTPGGVQLLPYAHPRVAFDLLAFQVDGEERTDTEFRFEIDLGADARLGQALVIRVGATLGDVNTFGAGLAYNFSRRLIVR